MSRGPEVRNLAGDPALAPVLADMRRRLEASADRTNDPWLVGERPVPYLAARALRVIHDP